MSRNEKALTALTGFIGMALTIAWLAFILSILRNLFR
jgi:hypothetical protein